MNPFFTDLQTALQENPSVIYATAVDTLGYLGGGEMALISQKAFLSGSEPVAETPSMVPFWKGLLEEIPEDLPHTIQGETWFAMLEEVTANSFPAQILEKLAEGENLVLGTVTRASSSIPCARGTKIAIDLSGALFGTLSSEEAEARVIKAAADVRDSAMPKLLECPTAIPDDSLLVLLEPVNL